MVGSTHDVPLSIVIVSWNTLELTRQCLHSIHTTCSELVYDVWVVDNNSSDGSVDMIKAEFPEVKLIENSQNEGFSRACNRALAKSSGEYALLLNSDTIVLEDALLKMSEFMQAHARVGVLGCNLVGRNGGFQYSAGWFPGLTTVVLGGKLLPMVLGRLLHVKRFPGQVYLSERAHETLQEVDWVVGACMLVRRSAMEDAGLLDERLFMYGEEVEWCYRIGRAGWSVVYFPQARVIHLGGGSSESGGQQSVVRSAFGEWYLYHKYHGRVSSFIYDVVRLVSSGLKVCVWGVVALVAPDSGRVRRRVLYHRAVLTARKEVARGVGDP